MLNTAPRKIYSLQNCTRRSSCACSINPHYENSILPRSIYLDLKNSHPHAYKSKYYKRAEETKRKKKIQANSPQREGRKVKKCKERFIKINKFGPQRETVREKGTILLADNGEPLSFFEFETKMNNEAEGRPEYQEMGKVSKTIEKKRRKKKKERVGGRRTREEKEEEGREKL